MLAPSWSIDWSGLESPVHCSIVLLYFCEFLVDVAPAGSSLGPHASSGASRSVARRSCGSSSREGRRRKELSSGFLQEARKELRAESPSLLSNELRSERISSSLLMLSLSRAASLCG